MAPWCGSWIALPPEHMGRGTPAISGGAAFYSFGHFTVFQGFRCPRNAYFNMSWVRIPSDTHFLVMGSNPTICNHKIFSYKIST